MARSLLLPAAFAVLLCGLAGCFGDATDPEAGADPTGDGADESAGNATSLLKPQWAVGDAWTYDFNGDSTTYVITAETGSDWFMETDSAERSFSDLRQDVSRLGPQRKSDLAGSQGQDRVEFFRWPLEAGRTWTTTWDHLDVGIRVMEVTGGVATLEAHLASDGSLAYRYTYDAEQGWFGDLRHFAPDGGELVHLALKKASHAWTGTIVRWDLIEVNASKGTGGANIAGPIEVPAGITDLWGDYHFTCTGPAGYLVDLEPVTGLASHPTPQGYQDNGQCVQVDVTKVLVEAPANGKWALTLDVGGQTADFDYTFLLRTRIDVPFPA